MAFLFHSYDNLVLREALFSRRLEIFVHTIGHVSAVGLAIKSAAKRRAFTNALIFRLEIPSPGASPMVLIGLSWQAQPHLGDLHEQRRRRLFFVKRFGIY